MHCCVHCCLSPAQTQPLKLTVLTSITTGLLAHQLAHILPPKTPSLACPHTRLVRAHSDTDTLKGEEKFFCNECGAYQEAQKRTRLAALPEVLLLHLNRFKYSTHMDRCVVDLLKFGPVGLLDHSSAG